MDKKIVSIHRPHAPHMVGDGLPVSNFFSYTDFGRKELSPFLMLDYGFPSKFDPTEQRLGVGMHPHRGFETVTLVFSGEIEHADTSGNRGVIGPGDVQWMTAGSGVLHEEMHSDQFRRNGGVLHFVQLWVNLPADKKMMPPRYQTLLRNDIPTVSLAGVKASLRVVAGEYGDVRGPAVTNTPVNVWDLTLEADAEAELAIPVGFTTALIVLDGKINTAGVTTPAEPSFAILDRTGDTMRISTATGAHVLVLSGEPIDEPVVGYGPFVMNTQQEIYEAINDLRSGTFIQSAGR